MDANLFISKKKAKKSVRRKDLPILKKHIEELFALISQKSFSSSIISLQIFSNMDISSVNFHELNDKIINIKDNNKKIVLEVIHSYYYFEKEYKLWFDHYKKIYSNNMFNFLVNNKIHEYFSD